MIIFDSESLKHISVNELREKLEHFELSAPGICLGSPKDKMKAKALSDMNVQILPDAGPIEGIKIAREYMARHDASVSIISSNPFFYSALTKGAKIYIDNPEELSVYTPEDFEEKMGIRADQVVDMFFVTGFPSIGIPQWAPIPPATAKSWIQDFGSFYDLVRSENSPVKNHPMSGLIASRSGSSLEAYEQFKKDLSGRPEASYRSDLYIRVPEDSKNEINTDGALRTLGEIAKFLSKNQEAPIAIALEGPKSKTSYNLSQNVRMIEFHIEGGDTAFIDLSDFSRNDNRLRSVIVNALSERKGPKCSDDAKAAYCFLGNEAFEKDDFYINDIGLIAYGLDNRKSEPTLESLMLGFNESLGPNRSEDILKCYSILRADVVKPGNERVKDQILNIEIPLNKILAKIEYRGIPVDASVLNKNERKLRSEAAQIKKAIDKMANRPVSLSNDELRHFLFTERKLKPVKFTPKRQPSVSEEALELIADQDDVVKKILKYKSIMTMFSSGIDPIKNHIDRKTGRVHPSLNQDLTNTGRLSCSNPNLQAIPANSDDAYAVRSAIGKRKGRILVKADYSQAEIFVLAALSGCSRLQNTLMSGSDIHQATAAEVFGKSIDEVTDDERRAAKAINFGIIYGMTSYGISKKLGVSNKVAQGYIDKYFQKYPVIEGFIDALKEHAVNDNYVMTGMGRRIYLKRPGEKLGLEELKRRGVNAPMQGTVADIVKHAMVALDKSIKSHPENLDAEIIMQVHDEIIISCDESQVHQVRELVEKSMSSKFIKFMPNVDITTNYTLEKNDLSVAELAIAK